MNLQANKEAVWKASQAWTFLLAVGVGVLVDLSVAWILFQTRQDFKNWAIKHPSIVDMAITIFTFCWWLLFAPLCSKVKGVYDFICKVGLTSRLTLSTWFYSWIAVGIGLLMWYGGTKGWGIHPSLTIDFYKLGKMYWLFFLIISIVIGPIVEEVVMRGFLYHAFRGSYDIFLSIFLILCVHGAFHLEMFHSLFNLACLNLFEISLCLIKERTGNTWNCVICHAIFNAMANLQWVACFVGLIILLPICVSWRRKPQLQKFS